jgi:hypothetical protein
MELDGPVFVYRWKRALEQVDDSLTFADDLTKVVSVPFGITNEHAEGLTLTPGVPLSALVCYDSPVRLAGANGVLADVFGLDG